MAEASVKLRISQSALSKRITTLENHLGYPLIRRAGRRALLTDQAIALLDEIEPVIAQLNDVLRPKTVKQKQTVSIAMADAIMASWGATLMSRLKYAFQYIEFEVHSHRTAMVLERLNRGQYQLGICTGEVTESETLIVQPLINEPMALVISSRHLGEFEAWKNDGGFLNVICIEQKSSMWRWLAPKLGDWRLKPSMQIESSVAAARLAVEGFGHALVPEGVARIIAPNEPWLTLESNVGADFPLDSLYRPCSLISRKTVLNDETFKDVFEFIKNNADSSL